MSPSFGGTVTGERGVGTNKKKCMVEEHGEAYLLIAQLKQSSDPLNIMHPGKLVSVN